MRYVEHYVDRVCTRMECVGVRLSQIERADGGQTVPGGATAAQSPSVCPPSHTDTLPLVTKCAAALLHTSSIALQSSVWFFSSAKTVAMKIFCSPSIDYQSRRNF